MKSKYQDRPTVGSIYVDAQKNVDETLRLGDISHELANSLIDDLNEAIKSNPFEGKPFYILIHERKDLQMKKAILRSLHRFPKRPWPEDDTVVFYHDTPKQETLFCWCLPHWTEMDNILFNESLYEREFVEQIKAWKRYDLYHFGFRKDEIGNWEPNPNFKDKPLVENKPKIVVPSTLLI